MGAVYAESSSESSQSTETWKASASSLSLAGSGSAVPVADKAVEDFYLLFPASVLTFDRFMDNDFFNQRIQKFSRQFCGIDILFHQT